MEGLVGAVGAVVGGRVVRWGRGGRRVEERGRGGRQEVAVDVAEVAGGAGVGGELGGEVEDCGGDVLDWGWLVWRGVEERGGEGWLAYAEFMGHHRLDEPVPC